MYLAGSTEDNRLKVIMVRGPVLIMTHDTATTVISTTRLVAGNGIADLLYTAVQRKTHWKGHDRTTIPSCSRVIHGVMVSLPKLTVPPQVIFFSCRVLRTFVEAATPALPEVDPVAAAVET